MASATKDDGKKNEMSDAAEAAGSSQPEKVPAPRPAPAAAATGPAGDGFFTIHKKGQGYWTRMGTIAGAALIAILTAQFLYSRLHAHTDLSTKTLFVIDAAFLIVYALIVFRVTNKPNVVDFLIATDSEMKKVNWTTRQELIGSTKVVIFFMLIIMALLFLFDVVFGFIFGPHGLHVLETSW